MQSKLMQSIDQRPCKSIFGAAGKLCSVSLAMFH